MAKKNKWVRLHTPIAILTAPIFIVLFGSLFILFYSLKNMELQEWFNHIGPVSITCGVMFAVLAYIRDRYYQDDQNTRQQDETYLSLARESFDEVFILLEDRNNNRETWVRAARLLLHGKMLHQKIVSDEIKEAYLLSEEHLRSKLYRTLNFEGNDFAEKQPLPPQFFYGINGWETEQTLENAAIKSCPDVKAQWSSIDKNYDFSGSSELSPASVIAIFDFLKFPENYDDPLKTVPTWDDRWEDASGIDMGARRYIHHRSTGYALEGEWHSYKKKDDS